MKTSSSAKLLRVIWTSFSVVSAVQILGITLGDAAWNGINLWMGLYLTASGLGTVALFVGFYSAFSKRRFFSWVTFCGALSLVGLSGVYSVGFLIEREPGRLLLDPIYIGGVPLPLLVIYGAAFVFCSLEAIFYFPHFRELENS